jgi:hypothetical protein
VKLLLAMTIKKIDKEVKFEQKPKPNLFSTNLFIRSKQTANFVEKILIQDWVFNLMSIFIGELSFEFSNHSVDFDAKKSKIQNFKSIYS